MPNKKDTRSRKYLITYNNFQDHGDTHESIIAKLHKYSIEYLALCDETGGKKHVYHVHIYVKFSNAIQFSTIKKLLPLANIATANGSSMQNRNYILKGAPEHNKKSDGTYEYTDTSGKVHQGQNHTDTFYEEGECPLETKGKRTDLENMYELIKEGYSDAEILEKCPDTAIMHIDKINKLRLTYLTDKFKNLRRLDLKVHYITGTTGLGKSRDILDEYGDENVYRVTDYQHPFDMYQCQSVLVLEEFRSSLRLQDMLNYLDIYPVILPARYSNKIACYTTVFVVSNWEFEQQYAELQKDPEQITSYNALIRRFNGYVKEYTPDKVKTYPTMQDYLKRNENFHPVTTPTPFQSQHQMEISDSEKMPFDD